MVDVSKALNPNQARKLLNEHIKNGAVVFVSHALAALADDGLTAANAYRVLKNGHIDAPEYEKCEWRYRIHLNDVWLVFAFRAEDNTVVITAWRKKS